MSESKSQLVYNCIGKPSVMVKIPKFKISDVIEGGSDTVHPAFLVGGKEIDCIYVSKYQNVVVNGHAYSLPLQKPTVNITYDEAASACEKNGSGWHLMSNAEWAAIALWSLRNGTLPHGNTASGHDRLHPDEMGIPADGYTALTGSGPDTWSHDHTNDGIFDLTGNIWEWVSGLRLMDGEIQMQDGESWKPVLIDGKAAKYAESEDGVKLTTGEAGGWNGCRFSEVETDLEVPETLKALALFPLSEVKSSDYFWIDGDGERLPLRGGHWSDGSDAGVFSLNLSDHRAYSGDNIGFRSAFVQL